MSKEYVQVDQTNIDKLLAIMLETPGQVVLALSADALQRGLPVSEILRPPYRSVMLPLTIGVAVCGKCAVCGEDLRLSIDRHTGKAMTQPGSETSPLLNWTGVEKNGNTLRIFIPKPAAMQVAYELRQY